MEHPIKPYVLDPSGQDIHGEAARLRARGNITRVDLCGVPAWAITSYEALRSILGDPRVSRDPRQHWPAWINGEIPSNWPLFTWLEAENMFTAHGPQHRRLRSVVAKALTPARIEALQPRIQEITDDCLDSMTALRDRIVDLRTVYAQEIPVRVFCELMGITDAGLRDRMCGCVQSLFHTARKPDEVLATHNEIHDILVTIIDRKRAAPGDDLTSALIHARAEEGDARLTEKELVGSVLVMMMGGYETTANLLANAIHIALVRPDQMALLRNGTVSWNDMIEETLRFQSPVANLPLRFAVDDIDVGGVIIAKGDAIVAPLAAAGRDPLFYGADADQFDATRNNKKNLAFGYGIHYCIGAPLARVEAQIALPSLFRRYPGVTLAAEGGRLEPQRSVIMNGFRTLPVRIC
ncbi:cytochrome P450 family protein [Burkholderia sola]|uniref:cytochrome P450 family protein n=1 Tax=Burkholderia sola TaxID=2843302 RepID=UPI00338D6AFE